MPNEDNKKTEESAGNKEANSQGSQNSNAEQSTPTESGSKAGQAQSEQIDLTQIHDMLVSKDKELNDLRAQIADLKKANTELILKVNTGSDKAPEDPFKVLYDEVILHK